MVPFCPSVLFFLLFFLLFFYAPCVLILILIVYFQSAALRGEGVVLPDFLLLGFFLCSAGHKRVVGLCLKVLFNTSTIPGIVFRHNATSNKLNARNTTSTIILYLNSEAARLSTTSLE